MALYKKAKRDAPSNINTYDEALYRFFTCVNEVLEKQLEVAAFGDPNEIYCHPQRGNPYSPPHWGTGDVFSARCTGTPGTTTLDRGSPQGLTVLLFMRSYDPCN